MSNSGIFDTGTGELAPRAGEFLAGVLALSRISRVTVALESGHGAGPALLAAARLTAHAETCVLLDQWRGNPLADLTEALLDAEPDIALRPGQSLVQGLRQLQARKRHSFLVIFDRFDEYLAQDADQPHIVAYDRAFVEMANNSELDVHFLLVQDEVAEPLLSRFRGEIPGIGDGCLRMPAGDVQGGPASADDSRVSRRDRSFGMLLERLTAIAPAEEAAATRPHDARPAIDVQAADGGSPAAEPPSGSGYIYRPVVDEAVIDEVPPVEHGLSAPAAGPESDAEPAYAPMQVAATDPPRSMPARETTAAAAPPRRGNALAVLMAAVLAVGAGLYAYRQKAPVAPDAPDAPAATAKAAEPVGEPAIAVAPAVGADQQPPASPEPALAAASPAPPAPAATPATPVSPVAAGTAAGASSAAGAGGAMPTVYVHVRSQRDRERLQALTRTLAGQGIRLVDVKVMSNGPSVADLRYFREEDRQMAVTVQKALASAGVPLPRLSRMNGFEGSTRPNHFEAWLSSDATSDPVRRR